VGLLDARFWMLMLGIKNLGGILNPSIQQSPTLRIEQRM
jgi:hypothetical protein